MQNKHLVLFTSDFPFGTGETFLETEILFLANAFEKVIVVSLNQNDEQTRVLPNNCEAMRMNLAVTSASKLKAMFHVFHPTVREEINIIKRQYSMPFNAAILKTMLVSFERAKRVKKYILKHWKTELSSTVFYSYWCDDVALGIAFVMAENKKAAGIARMHGWDVYFERSTCGYLPFRHFIVRQLLGIYSISQTAIDYAAATWKVDYKQKFILARLGVSNERPLKTVERDHFLIVSCSSIIPLKRVHLIAEAIGEIKNHKIKWVHFGDGPERAKLESLISTMSTNISVELKGAVPNAAIYSFYDENRPDLFINVSSTEGIPVSIMEAMSFGIPVLATNVGGTGEIVNDQNGILLPASIDAFDLANTLFNILNKRSNLTVKKKAAFRMWQENFKAEKNYQDFVEIINAN